MSKHTPGPWKANIYDGGAFEIISESPKYVAPGMVVAGRNGYPAWGLAEESTANGHMIAAAPELLEALEATQWASRTKFPSDGKYHAVCPLCENEPRQGHAKGCLIGGSITKAKGEKSGFIHGEVQTQVSHNMEKSAGIQSGREIKHKEWCAAEQDVRDGFDRIRDCDCGAQ
jgi:hypothetical protein